MSSYLVNGVRVDELMLPDEGPAPPPILSAPEAHPYERAAIRIIKWLHVAEQDLVGCAVTLQDGSTGIVRELKLDESHGLCFTCDIAAAGATAERYRNWKPVSSITDVTRGLQP